MKAKKRKKYKELSVILVIFNNFIEFHNVCNNQEIGRFSLN